MDQTSRFMKGLSDTLGVVGVALLGFGASHLFSLNIFDAGCSHSSIFGIVLVGLVGGLGLQIARGWRHRKHAIKKGQHIKPPQLHPL